MTAQLSFGSTKDMIDRILSLCGVDTTNQTRRRDALNILNLRYTMILSGKKWRFLHRELHTDLVGPYEVGTISITHGSTAVTVGTGSPTFTSAMIGQKLYVPGAEAVHEIEDVPTSTTLTLKSEWTDETISSSAYKILTDTYEVDGDLARIEKANLGGSLGRGPEIYPSGLDLFRQEQRRGAYIVGVPRRITAYSKVDSGDANTIFEVWPAPDKDYTIMVDHGIAVTALEDSESDYMLIPNKYHHVLFYAAAADFATTQDNFTKANDYSGKFSAAYAKFCGDREMTDNRPKVERGNNYYERARLRFRRRGRPRVDLS